MLKIRNFNRSYFENILKLIAIYKKYIQDSIYINTYLIFSKIILEYTIPALKGFFYSVLFPIFFLYYTIPFYGLNFSLICLLGYYISMIILYNTIFYNKKSRLYFFIGTTIVGFIALLIIPG